jgi:hypothetical protein
MMYDQGIGVSLADGRGGPGRDLGGGVCLLGDRGGPGGDLGGVGRRGGDERTRDRHRRGGLVCRPRYVLYL